MNIVYKLFKQKIGTGRFSAKGSEEILINTYFEKQEAELEKENQKKINKDGAFHFWVFFIREELEIVESDKFIMMGI